MPLLGFLGRCPNLHALLGRAVEAELTPTIAAWPQLSYRHPGTSTAGMDVSRDEYFADGDILKFKI